MIALLVLCGCAHAPNEVGDQVRQLLLVTASTTSNCHSNREKERETNPPEIYLRIELLAPSSVLDSDLVLPCYQF
jgi:hypothetical protein